MNADIPWFISPRNWSLKKSVTSFPNSTGSTIVLPWLSCIVGCMYGLIFRCWRCVCVYIYIYTHIYIYNSESGEFITNVK